MWVRVSALPADASIHGRAQHEYTRGWIEGRAAAYVGEAEPDAAESETGPANRGDGVPAEVYATIGELALLEHRSGLRVVRRSGDRFQDRREEPPVALKPWVLGAAERQILITAPYPGPGPAEVSHRDWRTLGRLHGGQSSIERNSAPDSRSLVVRVSQRDLLSLAGTASPWIHPFMPIDCITTFEPPVLDALGIRDEQRPFEERERASRLFLFCLSMLAPYGPADTDHALSIARHPAPELRIGLVFHLHPIRMVHMNLPWLNADIDAGTARNRAREHGTSLLQELAIEIGLFLFGPVDLALHREWSRVDGEGDEDSGSVVEATEWAQIQMLLDSDEPVTLEQLAEPSIASILARFSNSLETGPAASRAEVARRQAAFLRRLAGRDRFHPVGFILPRTRRLELTAQAEALEKSGQTRGALTLKSK